MVGVDRATRAPSLVTFEVDPHADRQAGITLHFVHDVRNGQDWKAVWDPKGGIDLPFDRCNKNTCTAILGGGVAPTPDGAGMDVVAKMQSEDHLFVGYARNGHWFFTPIDVAIFKEAYQHMLEVEFPVPAPAGKKP